eukprot:XP_017170760.1 PREDICTED: zinc finger protein 431-like isoform X1 [Mus musculus]
MPDQISVSEFVAEALEDYMAPTASSFTTRTAQCRNTVAAIEEDAVTYDDVHVNFTGEEWNLLDPSQKSLYKDVMLETYWNLTVIGYTWENHHIERHCQSSRRNERYVNNHSGEKLYECNECSKAFSCPSHLQSHKRRQIGEKTHEHNQCGKAFPTPSHLQYHKRTYTGEKPYECHQCGQAFKNAVISNVIKEPILERYLMNVINVVKTLQNSKV